MFLQRLYTVKLATGYYSLNSSQAISRDKWSKETNILGTTSAPVIMNLLFYYQKSPFEPYEHERDSL
jgi:hypothetical protein